MFHHTSPLFFSKKIIIAFIFLLLGKTIFSQITITTDQSDATYGINESMNFEVTSTTGGTVDWILKYDNFSPIISSGSFPISSNEVVNIPYTATEAGVVICQASINNGAIEVSAAAIQPFDILPFVEEPADFDAFWASKRADLAAIPMNPNLTFYSSNTYSTTYRVELDNIDNRTVYGYLTIPNGTGPFPAIIKMPAYGTVPNNTSPEIQLAEDSGMLSFSVSIHNVPPDQVDPNAYTPDNYTNENENYYKYGMLAAVRAIDYIFSRSDFDGANVAVVGESQGGGLSICIAGLDDRVNLLAYSNPTLSQNAGLHYDRAGGFPNYINNSRQADGTLAHELLTVDKTRYYDAMFFARRYDGPVLAAMSYEDLITPMATGMATFNQLAGNPKILVHELELGHEHSSEFWNGRYPFFRRFFPSTLNTIPNPYVSTSQGYFIDAGNDITSSGSTITLSGIVENNNIVNDPSFELNWEKVSGPGTVSFSASDSYNNVATFSSAGTYVLQFSAVNNSVLDTERKYFTLFDNITVTVGNSNNDSTPPSVTLSTPLNTVEGDFIVTLNFSENITGLSLNDFIISNGTLSMLSGNNDTYTINVSPTTSGDVILYLPQQTFTDIAGNFNNENSNILNTFFSVPNNVGDCNTPTNLAFNKVSTQHSTQSNGSASRANDGNTDGNFWGANSTSLTNWTFNAWWEVDLGTLSDITTINVWNRTDCCEEFLKNYYVFVSNTPFTSTNLNSTINQNGVTSFLETGQAGLPTAININQQGRYVRVQLAGQGFLGLAEVEVMGCVASGGTPIDQVIDFPTISDKLTTDNPFYINGDASSGLPVSYTVISGPANMIDNLVILNGAAGTVVIEATQLGNTQYNPAPPVVQSFVVSEPVVQGNCNSPINLGIGKVAIQSGTQLNAVANRAIDGNTNGNFWADNSCSLTNWVSNPWWEVDLEVVAEIESIRLWNRTDCCDDLFSDVHIFISETPFTSTNLSTTLNQTGVIDYFVSGDVGFPSNISINTSGRYVRVQLAGTSYLAIAEVEILGCVNGSGCAPAGTTCNDNNAATYDDVEDGDCNCSGTLCPTLGTVCDDGNVNTENDVEDGFCNCIGIPTSAGCATTTNLALNQNVSQGSTLTISGITGNPEKAVDGNTNGVFFTNPPSASSVSATKSGNKNWWQVDLGDSYFIEDINVFNRTDGQNQTNDIYILISNTPFTSNNLGTARAQANYEAFISGTVGSPSTIEPSVEGRYVRIQRSSGGYLVLAEVEVFGCAAGVNANANNNTLIINPYQNYLHFDVAKEGREVELNWVTNTEIENDFFIIEKSRDGILFEPILEVNSKSDDVGSSFYKEKDNDPHFGKNYYRLQQFAKNGSSIYSPMRVVDFDLNLNEIKVYPNPAQEKIQINLEPFISEDISIQILDARGVLMFEKNIVQLSERVQTFDLATYQNGLYLMAIKVKGNKMVTKQFVVLKEY